MPLAKKLSNTRDTVQRILTPGVFARIEASIEVLKASGLAERAVGTGGHIALPVLRTIDGLPVDLIETAAGRPVVLVFYRGGWCPYCNVTLRAYAQALPLIERAGAAVIAVTPETPEEANRTARRNDLGFAVAVDRGNRFARTLGLVFDVPADLRPLYREIGIDLPVHNGDSSFELPIPAVYVLDAVGRVLSAHVEADFTIRADPADALAVLNSLKARRPSEQSRAA
jgi:peroxiredoxin